MYNLPQKDLCKEICQVSHLSLIENNKIEAKPEMIQLLSEKMKAFKSSTEIQNDGVQNEHIREFFFKERLEHGIIQEILCYGICTVSYLSKNENNKLKPSFKIKNSLYRRLKEIKNNTVNLKPLEVEKLYDNMISFFHKKKINADKKLLHQGLQVTKNKYPKLNSLFLYQKYVYFDQKNLKNYLETSAIPYFRKETSI
ncbi:XRE family transcriptional regulator [Bacillus thuringiensis]|nr:XRE family transcriptional regulator [Bacillus thuringiensis]